MYDPEDYERRAKGERQGLAKMTDEDVLLARELYRERTRMLQQASYLTVEALAKKFEISASAMRAILHYNTWKHLP